MKYGEVLDNLHKNNMLNEKGYYEYVKILKNDIIYLRTKIMDLENQLKMKVLRGK